MYNSVTIDIVGCGGVICHGLSGLKPLLYTLTEDVEIKVRCWDKDIIEDRNKYRQWDQVGECKSQVVEILLSDMPIKVSSENKFFRYEEFLQTEAEVRDDSELRVILGCPDNHLGRIEVGKACDWLAKSTESRVLSIITGNTGVNGYAYGMWHIKGHTGEDYDWRLAHPDIEISANRELVGLEDAQSCVGEGGEVPQNFNSNMYTGILLVDMLRTFLGVDGMNIPIAKYGTGGMEYTWYTYPDGNISIYKDDYVHVIDNVESEVENGD